MISPDASILSVARVSPRIHPSAFIAAGARIIGDVEVQAQASIWYNCVLRGDINSIVVGARSNLQDGTIVHVEGPRTVAPGLPTLIGEDVLVGHMAVLHGCILEPGAFVGMGAIVMDNCRVGTGSMLAAGAMLTPGKSVPGGELWAGRPAALKRALTAAEQEEMAAGVRHYVENAGAHAAAIRVKARPI